ncbi:hypothetical protein CASFOL_034257 [Castilleja foliolosa]|uniref:CCHC-type domain-containing protein n=1 Tax=Castilleja foliolosa TaxID=1961234 RepID=A0ABD3BYP9_9LAMI
MAHNTDNPDSLNLEDMIIQNPQTETQNENIDKEYAIIARIIAPKPLNMNAFKTTILKAWNNTSKVQTNLLGDNKMAFIFAEKRDMEKVMNQAWTFRDHQLVTVRWPPDKAHNEIELNRIRFWVHIFGIPVAFVNQGNAEAMGNELGKFVKTDLHSAAQKWKRSLKLQIEIDITKPLSGELEFFMGSKSYLLEVRYERLNDFCHNCGRIGHKGNICGYAKNRSENLGNNNEFGPWLRYENHHIKNPNIHQLDSARNEISDINGQLERNAIRRSSAGNTDLVRNPSLDVNPIPKEGGSCNVHITDKTTIGQDSATVENPNLLLQKELCNTMKDFVSGKNTPLRETPDKGGKKKVDFLLGLDKQKGQIENIEKVVPTGPDPSPTHKRKLITLYQSEAHPNELMSEPEPNTTPIYNSQINPNSQTKNLIPDFHSKIITAISHYKKPKLTNALNTPREIFDDKKLQHYIHEIAHGKPTVRETQDRKDQRDNYQISRSSGSPRLRKNNSDTTISTRLAQPKAVRALKFLISDSKADIVFISEVKTTLSPLISNSLSKLSLTDFCFCPPNGTSGGLILAWKNHINLKVITNNRYFIHASISSDNTNWLFTAVYVPCNYQKKLSFWQEISSLAPLPGVPWLMFGDFNDILDQKEKKGGLPFASSSSHSLQNDLNDNGLIDLGF